MSSEEALAYLADQHGVHRSPVTLAKMHYDGRLPADAHEGRFRRYSPRSIDAYVARELTPTQNLKEGIPVMGTKDLTTKKFHGGGKAGAEDTERRTKLDANEGGKGAGKKMFGAQSAAVKTKGKTGPDDEHDWSQFAAAGPKVPGRKSAQGISAPPRSGRTGNTDGAAANEARSPRRSRSRDYSKYEGPIR
jgi:hypothetical protein